MTPSLRTIWIIAALVQIAWGLTPSASSVVIAEIPVELYISIRWTISGAIFFALVSLRGRREPWLKKETIAVALLGIGGYALGSLGTLYGLKIGGIANFALTSAFSPLVTSAVSVAVLREKPQPSFFVALPVAIAGLLLLVIGKQEISSWNVALTSSFLVLGAAFFESLSFVFSKRLRPHFGAFQYLAIAQLSTAALFWGLQLAAFHQIGHLAELSPAGWGSLIFVSIVSCVLCYGILYWLLTFVEGHRLALFDGLHSVSAALFGILIFHEHLNATMAAGGALVLAGLFLGIRRRSD